MSIKQIIVPLILTLIYAITLTAQNTPLEVYVHDNYTDKPLESVLVTVFQNGILIDSAYTDINGIAFISGVTSVRGPVGLPTTMSLSHNYPNPFRDDTNVEIGIPEAQTIIATVYNILGQRVASEQLPVAVGYYTLNLSLGHLPTGVYFLRIDGRESQAIKLLKMGRGVHPSGPVFSISGSSFRGRATIGKFAVDEYIVQAVKDRYDVYEAVLEQPLRGGVAVPLARNNIVEFVVVDAENNPVAKQLEIKTTDYQSTITTTHTLTLKSGVYAAIGEVEQGISLERTVEIPSVDTTVVLTFEEAGVKLEGAPDAPAMDATYDLYVPIIYPEEFISIDPDLLYDGQVLRTEIEIILDPEVTIGEVNDLLDKYNAQIVNMLEGNTIFIIRVPDPGDVASLNQLIEDIENEERVLFALKSVMVEDPEPVYEFNASNDLQKIPDHITNYTRIDHHLAARAHAAWNLRDAITTMVDIRPRIVIADVFGDGAPGGGYNASFINTDFASGNVNAHGYHVLGIISGTYDRVSNLSDPQNHVMGMFPDWLMVRAVDLQSSAAGTWPQRTSLIIQRIKNIITSQLNARIVVNTSLNSREFRNQMPWARAWILKVRGGSRFNTVGAGLENKFIHFTSAGNIGYDDAGDIIRWPAKDNSFFNYAVLGDITMEGMSIPNLTNTFVVENRVNTAHQDSDTQRQRPIPGCANNNSIMGGNLSAIGTDVWSFGRCLEYNATLRKCTLYASDPRASNMTGTSMATPQAAGVAAYVWGVNPNLTVSEVMDIMRRTAEERATNTLTPGVTCNEVIPQSIVDAYAAVLAAGGADARRFLLDVKKNGVFDHNDIEEFLGVYLDVEKAGKLDYSRYDLNGDGLTGGGRTDRFDLTMDGKYSVVEQKIEEDTVYFHESNVTDLQILCYYAYSDLYRGDESERNKLLSTLCETDCPPVIDIDNEGYRTVKIGGQCWMAENLKVSRYRNGDLIPNLTEWDWEYTEDGAWIYYDNDTTNNDLYGKLYNWFAVDDSRGLCPTGWHVPSDDDWKKLEKFLGMSKEEADKISLTARGTDEGGKLKSIRTEPAPHPRWQSPNTGATDEVGFAGLPGGEIDFLGGFEEIGRRGNWWSSTGSDGLRAFYREIIWVKSSIHRSPRLMTTGYSVRCVRDKTSPANTSE
jgi:uncharacterized protein (TIGR02145 family)